MGGDLLFPPCIPYQARGSLHQSSRGLASRPQCQTCGRREGPVPGWACPGLCSRGERNSKGEQVEGKEEEEGEKTGHGREGSQKTGKWKLKREEVTVAKGKR